MMDPFDSQQGMELQRALDSWFADRHGLSLADADARLNQLHYDYTTFQGLTDVMRRHLTRHSFVCSACRRAVLQLVALSEQALVVWETDAPKPPAAGDPADDQGAEFVRAVKGMERQRPRPKTMTVVPLEWFDTGDEGKFPFPVTCRCETRRLDHSFVLGRINSGETTTML